MFAHYYVLDARPPRLCRSEAVVCRGMEMRKCAYTSWGDYLCIVICGTIVVDKMRYVQAEAYLYYFCASGFRFPR